MLLTTAGTLVKTLLLDVEAHPGVLDTEQITCIRRKGVWVDGWKDEQMDSSPQKLFRTTFSQLLLIFSRVQICQGLCEVSIRPVHLKLGRSSVPLRARISLLGSAEMKAS